MLNFLCETETPRCTSNVLNVHHILVVAQKRLNVRRYSVVIDLYI